MKDNFFAKLDENKKSGFDFGVLESGIDESRLLKELAGLKMGTIKDKPKLSIPTKESFSLFQVSKIRKTRIVNM